MLHVQTSVGASIRVGGDGNEDVAALQLLEDANEGNETGIALEYDGATGQDELTFNGYLNGSLNGENLLTIERGGNVGIKTDTPTRDFFVNGDAGGTAAWYNDSHSSFKEKFEDVEVLEKVKKLNIKEWQYTREHSISDNSRHISPFSEDFYSLFGLGDR
jgi:hypothetical protein